MKAYLEKLPRQFKALISLAQSISARHNMPAYLVGGFVRDLVLGAANYDLDITVEGDAVKIAREFGRRLKVKSVIHPRFGTATVMFKPHLKVDFSSSRRESYPCPAQLPVVECGMLKSDLFRRDFTINAMAISINKEDFGRLIDFFSGRQDLKDKKIRVLHDLSFIDDPTRILRAVRFEQRFNFKIEPKTLELLKEASRLKMLDKVQPQRLRDDLILMLKEPRPIKEIKRLQALTGFSFISPGLLSVSDSAYSLIRRLEKEAGWFRREIHQRRHLDLWLMYLMAILDGHPANEVKKICDRFAFHKGEAKRLLFYKALDNLKVTDELNKAGLRPSMIFSLLEPLSYEVIIMLKAKYSAKKTLQKAIENFLKYYNGTRASIRGADLAELGIAPGPAYQKVFTRLIEAKLDGLVRTKQEELSFVKESAFLKTPSTP